MPDQTVGNNCHLRNHSDIIDYNVTGDDKQSVNNAISDDISISLSVTSLRSESSDTTKESNESTFCRICHQNENPDIGNSVMISPCNCMGSMANVHHQCLQRWASVASTSCCDICGFTYSSHKTYPTFFKYMRAVISSREFTVELVITTLMVISTPLIIMATILSSLVNYSDQHSMKALVYSLWAITIFSWVLYSIMLLCTIRYINKSFHEWREKNINIELVLNTSDDNAVPQVVVNNCENYI